MVIYCVVSKTQSIITSVRLQLRRISDHTRNVGAEDLEEQKPNNIFYT